MGNCRERRFHMSLRRSARVETLEPRTLGQLDWLNCRQTASSRSQRRNSKLQGCTKSVPRSAR
jgi:hypothetical protein